MKVIETLFNDQDLNKTSHKLTPTERQRAIGRKGIAEARRILMALPQQNTRQADIASVVVFSQSNDANSEARI